jgi:hypothetical protein
MPVLVRGGPVRHMVRAIGSTSASNSNSWRMTYVVDASACRKYTSMASTSDLRSAMSRARASGCRVKIIMASTRERRRKVRIAGVSKGDINDR